VRRERVAPSAHAAQFTWIGRTQSHIGGEACSDAADLHRKDRVSVSVRAAPPRLKLPYGDTSILERADQVYKHSVSISTVRIVVPMLMRMGAKVGASRHRSQAASSGIERLSSQVDATCSRVVRCLAASRSSFGSRRPRVRIPPSRLVRQIWAPTSSGPAVPWFASDSVSIYGFCHL
jgi:hypothetical protein